MLALPLFSALISDYTRRDANRALSEELPSIAQSIVRSASQGMTKANEAFWLPAGLRCSYTAVHTLGQSMVTDDSHKKRLAQPWFALLISDYVQNILELRPSLRRNLSPRVSHRTINSKTKVPKFISAEQRLATDHP